MRDRATRRTRFSRERRASIARVTLLMQGLSLASCATFGWRPESFEAAPPATLGKPWRPAAGMSAGPLPDEAIAVLLFTSEPRGYQDPHPAVDDRCLHGSLATGAAHHFDRDLDCWRHAHWLSIVRTRSD